MQPNSAFNPDIFLQTNYDAPTSTVTALLPKDDYVGIIKELVPRQVQGTKDPSKWYLFLDFQVEIGTPPAIREELGRDVSRIRHSVSVELVEGSNAIDMGKGKNVQLGRIRDAAGQNEPGKPWNPAMLNNAMVKVSVVQEPSEKDPQVKYNRIASFGKA